MEKKKIGPYKPFVPGSDDRFFGEAVVKFETSQQLHLADISFDMGDDNRAVDLISKIRNGIRHKDYSAIKRTLSLVPEEWAKILGITTRTLDRYKVEGRTFSPQQSEKIVEIAQLVNYGTQVFGSGKKFNIWLNSKNVGLGGAVPRELLDTSIGLGMVKDELGRIEHGLFA